MDDKKRVIIEAAVKLFAEKGFNATAVQEIADQSNISKGAFYLHFSSKEELLFSIFRYYTDSIKEKLNKIAEEDLSPKEIFLRQVEMQYQETYANREMITMHFTERSLIAKDSMKKLFISQELERQEWLEKSFVAMFGEQIKPYIYDVSTFFTGMMQGFYRILIMGGNDLNLKHLSESVVQRLEDIVEGILNASENPVLTKETVDSFLEGLNKSNESPEAKVENLLVKMKKELSKIGLGAVKKTELEEAIDFLLEEVKSDEPKIVVMKGMLAHFKGIHHLNKQRKQIAELLKIDLI